MKVKNKPFVLTIVLIAVLFLLVIFTANTNSANGPVSFVGRLIKPVQRLIYGTGETVTGIFDSDGNDIDITEQYNLLKSQNEIYKAQLKEYDEVKAENERLKELLGFVKSSDYEIVSAGVIGTTPGGWFNEFIINAGTSDGIETGMVVYSSTGLVGKVVYTTGTYSRVQTFTSSNSGVPVMVERTRDNAVLKPSTDGSGELKLYYLDNGADIVPGDKILTSGLGGIYPKGIEVATVTEVSTDSNAAKIVAVQSLVDFNHIEEVTVILHIFGENE